MCSFIIDNIEWLILVGISQPKVFTIRRTALAEFKKNANKNYVKVKVYIYIKIV